LINGCPTAKRLSGMNKLSLIECVVIGFVVLIQFYMALRTALKIRVFKDIFPSQKFFEIRRFYIPLEDLRTLTTSQIISGLDLYAWNDIGGDPPAGAIEICLVSPGKRYSVHLENILYSINTYLLRNKGAITDFNLIKDIVERNIISEEEDISQSVSVPLYLGLMGTILGIIFGLANLFILSNGTGEFGIKSFLLGVSIAMIASFCGLMLTVLNGNFNFNKSKQQVDNAKNSFYTFLQTELLPELNETISSNVQTLHLNLARFNENFSSNLSRLSVLLNQNRDALIAQDNILAALKGVDIMQFADANVRILKQLNTSVNEFEKFNAYISTLNAIAQSTGQLSTQFQLLLSSTNNFVGLANKADARIDEINKLVEFLHGHFSELEARKLVINQAVGNLDEILQKSFDELRRHTEARIDAIKEITIKQEDLMGKALEENRKVLGKLALLENLNDSLSEFKRVFSSADVSAVNQLEEIKTVIKSLAEKANEKSWYQKVWERLKNA
jgi:hypothetical protein